MVERNRKPIRPKKNNYSIAEGIAWLCFTLLSLIFGIYMTARAAAESSHYDPQKETPESGLLQLIDQSGTVRNSLHLRSDVNFQISGLIARVELSQEFINDSESWMEGVYAFPLPENAAVNFMEIHIDERKIIGEIKEKVIAEKLYRKARQQGKRAALLEQQQSNIFIQKITNIPPGEKVKVTLHYLQTVEYNSGEFSLRFPMTLTPRYPSGAMLLASNIGKESYYAVASEMEGGIVAPLDWLGASAKVNTQPLHENMPGKLGSNIKISIDLNAGMPLESIESPFHEISIRKNTRGHHIEPQKGLLAMDRDFSLRWRPAIGREPKAAIFRERIDREDYLFLMMLPPGERSKRPANYLSRDIVFVIDTSGSMKGNSIVQAKRSLQLALSRLKPSDKFNIIEFNSNYRSLYVQAQEVNPNSIEIAINWVEELEAEGGTEINAALSAALAQFEQSGNLQQLVFITDGAVANESRLFKLIHQYLGDTRLFTVGIGSAPNSFFMRKAAQFGRGSFIHIASSSDLSREMAELIKKLESTVVSHINIQWPSEAEVYPEKIPDLYFGEPLFLSAKMPSVLSSASVNINGFTANEPWARKLSIDTAVNNQGVASIWARAKIEDLEDKKHRGMKADRVKGKVLKVALQHRLLSAYTGFIAVEQKIIRENSDKLRQTRLVNLPPYSLEPETTSLSYPQGATSAELSICLGILSMLVWFVYLIIRRLTES